jgi:hypothetical protein
MFPLLNQSPQFDVKFTEASRNKNETIPELCHVFSIAFATGK